MIKFKLTVNLIDTMFMLSPCQGEFPFSYLCHPLFPQMIGASPPQFCYKIKTCIFCITTLECVWMWQRMTDTTYVCKLSICATRGAKHITLPKFTPMIEPKNQYWEKLKSVVGEVTLYLYMYVTHTFWSLMFVVFQVLWFGASLK